MEEGIVMRIHRVRAEFVVAACDRELLGQDLPVGAAGRTVRISADFYGERLVSREELLWAMRRATVMNLLGRRVVAVAQREGIVAEAGLGTLGGHPHAEVFGMPE